jgi:phosphoribosylanthranilate isomerase
MNNNKLKIKVCGMRDKDNIRQLTALSPDYIGFIFYNKSKRYIGETIDKEILDIIPPSINKVGVFVDKPINELIARFNHNHLQFVQLHGHESVEYCKKIYYLGIPVIKVFHINEQFNPNTTVDFSPFCNYFLFDTKTPGYGGSGKKFNWDVIAGFQSVKPFFLSGGIDSDDINAIKKIKNDTLHAVDINSGFETAPGNKDIISIEAFIQKLTKEP